MNTLYDLQDKSLNKIIEILKAAHEDFNTFEETLIAKEVEQQKAKEINREIQILLLR